MKLYAIANVFVLLLFTCSLCSAQSSTSTLVVCLNKSTQKLTVKSSCTSSETVVSGKNLSTTTVTASPTPTSGSSSANLTGCYTTSAKRGASTFDGRIAVGVLCKQKTDLLINDQVTTTDRSGARPVVERKELVIKGKIPNGVEYGLLATGSIKKFYEVQVAAVCCPTVTVE